MLVLVCMRVLFACMLFMRVHACSCSCACMPMRVCMHVRARACTSIPLDQRTFADLVTAKLPLAQNAADIVALINAYKVPFATFETHKHAHTYIYATRNSATTQEPDAKSQRRRLSLIVSSPTCSGTIMPKPRLLLYALAHQITCPTIAYVLACTFLLLFAGPQNELKCMHGTLLDCTTRSKKKTQLCVHVL